MVLLAAPNPLGVGEEYGSIHSQENH